MIFPWCPCHYFYSFLGVQVLHYLSSPLLTFPTYTLFLHIYPQLANQNYSHFSLRDLCLLAFGSCCEPFISAMLSLPQNLSIDCHFQVQFKYHFLLKPSFFCEPKVIFPPGSFYKALAFNTFVNSHMPCHCNYLFLCLVSPMDCKD